MLVDRVIIGPTNPDNPEYRVYPAEVIRTVIKIIVRSVPGYQRVNGSPWCQKNCERRSIRVSTSCLCAKRFKKPVALPTGDDPMGMRGRTNERGSGVERGSMGRDLIHGENSAIHPVKSRRGKKCWATVGSVGRSPGNDKTDRGTRARLDQYRSISLLAPFFLSLFLLFFPLPPRRSTTAQVSLFLSIDTIRENLRSRFDFLLSFSSSWKDHTRWRIVSYSPDE